MYISKTIYIDDIYRVQNNKIKNEGIKSNTLNAMLVIGFSLHKNTAREISEKEKKYQYVFNRGFCYKSQYMVQVTSWNILSSSHANTNCFFAFLFVCFHLSKI